MVWIVSRDIEMGLPGVLHETSSETEERRVQRKREMEYKNDRPVGASSSESFCSLEDDLFVSLDPPFGFK